MVLLRPLHHIPWTQEIFNSPYAVTAFRKYSEVIPSPSPAASVPAGSIPKTSESLVALSRMARENKIWLVGGECRVPSAARLPETDTERDGEILPSHKRLVRMDRGKGEGSSPKNLKMVETQRTSCKCLPTGGSFQTPRFFSFLFSGAGSIPEIEESTDKIYNTCTVYNPDGELLYYHAVMDAVRFSFEPDVVHL